MITTKNAIQGKYKRIRAITMLLCRIDKVKIRAAAKQKNQAEIYILFSSLIVSKPIFLFEYNLTMKQKKHDQRQNKSKKGGYLHILITILSRLGKYQLHISFG